MKSLLNKICRAIAIAIGFIAFDIMLKYRLGFVVGTFWYIVGSISVGVLAKRILFPDRVINKANDDIEQSIYDKILKNIPDFATVFASKKPLKSENITNIDIESSNVFNSVPVNSTLKNEVLDFLVNNKHENIITEEDDISTKTNYEYNGEEIQTPHIEEKLNYVYQKPVYEESKLWLYIKNFFAENVLAKIGGILLFLGAMFFIGLIYLGVGGVGKLIIGLLFGFIVYGVGIYLDKKNLKVEAQICLGVGIAINFLVIIAGRYYNFDGKDVIIGQTTSFGFLIANTILAVITGMLYKFNIILVFGFLLAYLSPVLVGGKADDPYFVSTYATIVSIGALGLSRYISKQSQISSTEDTNIANTGLLNISNNLLWIGFLGGMVTFISALVGFTNYYVSQIIYISIIGIATIASAYMDKNKKNILNFTLGTYISIMLTIFIGIDIIASPYLLGIYIVILFAATIYMSYKLEDENTSKILLTITFIASMIIFLILPFVGGMAWIFKLAMMAIIGIFSMCIGSQKTYFTIGTYISVIMLMMSGAVALNTGFVSFVIYISYIMTFLAIGGYTIYMFYKNETIEKTLIFTMLIPLVSVIIFLSTGLINFLIPTIIFGFVMIMAGILLLKDKIDKITKYILFGGLGVYILAISGFINIASSVGSIYQNIQITSIEFVSIIIAAFVLLFISYRLSKKEDLQGLFPASTLMHILILIPILHNDNSNIHLSITAIILTLFANISFPVFSKKTDSLENVIGLIIGVLFVGVEVYRYDMINNGLVYGGQSVTGLIYIALALIYILPGLRLIMKSENFSNIKNIIYTYMGIGISSVAIAVAFIFAGNVSVLALSWISLGGILMYIYSRLNDIKVYFASLIMYGVGIFKMIDAFDFIKNGDLNQLAPIGIIFIFLIFGLYCIKNKTNKERLIYDIVQSIGSAMLTTLVLYIFGSGGYSQDITIISTIILFVSIIYSRFNTGYSKYILGASLAMVSLYQLINVSEILNNSVAKTGKEELLQYFSTALLCINGFVYYKSTNDKTKDLLLVVMSTYLFLISSIYVDYIFANTFILSIYWGILAYAALQTGISKNQIKFRTIGLYIIGLTLVKVGFYDIWYGIDSGFMRVIALMVLGGLLIYISTLYTRKYGGKMSGELDPSNLWTNAIESEEKTEL